MSTSAFGQLRSLCEDCNAEQQLEEVAPGIKILHVLHDDTCPRIQNMQPSHREKGAH